MGAAGRPRSMTLPKTANRADAVFIPSQTQPSDPAHGAAFIFLHGLGDSAEGLTNIAQQFQAGGKLAYMSWILPNACYDNDRDQQAWYAPTDFAPLAMGREDMVDAEDAEGMLKGVEYVEGLLDACVAKGIPPQRIVLGGFSQGCSMALLTDLTSRKYAGTLAGIVGLMGYLPLQKEVQGLRAKGELPPVVGDVPLFLARGQGDKLVPKKVWEGSLATMKQLGWDETSMYVKEYEGLGHGLNAEVLSDLAVWLDKAVPNLGD